jgi:hypothetical protein
MSSPSLQNFATKAIETRRITFADVRRLQRDILPEGIASREEAEILIDVDGRVGRSDHAWIDWLVAAVVDFAVWGERPTGYVEGEAARWLMATLSARGTPTKAGRLIAREVAREAEAVDEAIVTMADSAVIAGMEVATTQAMLAAAA